MDETTDGLGAAREGRVVVVGHDPDELRRLSSVLEPSGRRIVTVGTGGEARREIASDEPAVVVLDTRTASVDALEVVRAVRADEHTETTPVLVLVGNGSAAATAFDGALGLGAVDVVTAPVGDAVLQARVALLADLAVATRQLEAQAERLRLADEQAGEHRRVLASQQSVMRALAGGATDDVLPKVAQTLARGLGWHVGAYWERVGARVRCAESWFAPSFVAPDLARMQADETPRTPAELVGRAVRSGVAESASLSDLDGDDAYARAALAAGLTDAIALPIVAGSTVLGVIEMLRTSERPPDAHVIAMLDALCALVAQARRAEEETAALKNEFFALVSHELLTPLTSIVGYLEELLDGASGALNRAQEQDLEIIDRNARRLYRLVDDLMFVAQVETGKLSLDRVSVDLAAVVLEAIDVAQPSAKGREVQVVARLDSVGPVRGDARRLGQVVDHLISNAVKFSHPGGHVEVALREQGDEVVIEVIDEGLGIPLVEQPRVFDRFARSSIASAREIPGIGLGLSVSQVIAEAHGGSIAMHSVEGKGSTFTVTLPHEPLAGAGDTDHDED